METMVKEIDSQELKRMDGKDRNPVCIAFQGKVYDVSQSDLWKTGTHMARHASGQDLSGEMEVAPHGADVLDKFSQVGILKKSSPSADVKPLPRFLQKAFDRYPLLRRQPHPMTVHFPIAFLMATPLFLILYALTRNDSFETTSFYMLCLGVLGSAAAIATGFFAWWVNYGAVFTTYVKYKILLSMVLWVVLGIGVIWRFLDPVTIIQSGSLWWLYAILIFSLVPLVTLLGHIGGKMVFPK
jgi:predicted heme/steroid binding protein/uncharacterized membrane protein